MPRTRGSDSFRDARFLFHLTHEENIPGILEEGVLLSHNQAHERRRPKDVSDPAVQERRAAKVDPIHGRPLHDYVNLYFRARGPMLFARREVQRSLVVLYVDRRLLRQRGVIFTDGNAASDSTRFFSDPKDLEELDWDCLDAEHWTEFPDGRRKRAAEVLVPHPVRLALVVRAVVRQELLRRRLSEQGWHTPVDVRQDWFF